MELCAQTVVTVAGTGYHGTTGDGGAAICAGVPYPYHVAVDAAGNFYITGSNAIRKVDGTTGIITTIAGSTVSGYSGDGGPATAATMRFTFGICVDGSGNIYFSEYSNHIIRKITAATGIISTLAGNGSPGFSGDGGPATGSQLDTPEGICVDGAGNLFIADFKNSRVRKIDAATGIITTIGGTGSTAYSGDGGPGVNAGIPYPTAVCVDAAGNVYESEANSGVTCRVRKISKVTGIITTIAGNNAYTYSGDGGPASSASLFAPTGICLDAAGNLFIAEYDDSRIRKVDAATGIITTIAGTGVNGFSGDGGPATSADFYYPTGICADAAGNLFVADNFNQRVRKIYLHGNPPATGNVNGTLSISTPAQTICTGQDVLFSATVSNVGTNPSYQWAVNGLPVGTTQGQYSSMALADGDVVSCQITVAGSGCTAGGTIYSNTITMTVSPTPAPTVQIFASVAKVCAGDPVTFTAVPQDAGMMPAYRWTLDGNPAGDGSATYVTNQLSGNDKVSCLLLPDNVSCPILSDIVSNTLTVPVNPLPVIHFNPEEVSIAVGQHAQLHAVIAGVSGTYQWSPADGLVDASTLDPFTVVLTSTTQYQLLAVSGDGCKATKDLVVKVLNKFNMPNSFSPNGDGNNDVFRIPPTTFFILKELSVFDRWGNRIFSTRDRNVGWDGTYKGNAAPTGTYVYMISGSEGGKTEVIKGTVMLVR